MNDAGGVRLDKWLWAARFYKTRSLAIAAVNAGEVRVARERVKPARDVRPGDALQIRRGDDVMDVVVREFWDGEAFRDVPRDAGGPALDVPHYPLQDAPTPSGNGAVEA